MTIHLVKLCVGVDSVEELEAWRASRAAQAGKRGKTFRPAHTTRMVPKRADEIVSGGSLYWVIKGMIQVRSPVAEIRPFTDKEGIGRCDLILHPELIRVRPVPRRAFQGWRYLKAEDAPPDLAPGEAAVEDMPPKMRAELAELGLI